MNWKTELVKKIDNFFHFLGVDPQLFWIFVMLILNLFAARDIKNWKKKSKVTRNLDLGIWFTSFMFILFYIVRLIRGN
jgi:hypothetical protein